MKLLTLQQLQDHRACRDQIQLFRELFGESAIVTVKACVAVADKFNWEWAAGHLLKASAYAEYDRVANPAYAEYNQVVALAQAEYKPVITLAQAEYKQVTRLALAE